MSPVLVTGGSGYLATQLIATLLKDGHQVRATVRSPGREDELRAAVRRGGADGGGLEVLVADLMADDGWAAATAGCAEVHHVASPLIAGTEDPDELIAPAREGTLRVLRAARDAGARRVVMTSSFAAVGYSPGPGQTEFTEADRTDPEAPGLPPYPRSKALAERAAWDLIGREGGDLELAVVNPTFILGPTLTTGLSSVQVVQAMLDGTMGLAPRQWFGVADVRDVADLHLRAMATPEAAGKRYLALADGPTISFLGLARILRDRLGPLAERVPTEEAPGEEKSQLTIHNDRAKAELGWRPRPAETTIVETAESLRELGLLEEDHE